MMKANIEKLLREKFQPQFLEVMDDSAKHAGHNPDAKNGGTHFSISIVSQAFVGKSLVERHRMIYAALQEPLKDTVHALAIKARINSDRH